MGINTALVLAGISGAGTSGGDLAWFAPTGTTAPTDATTALASGTSEVQTVTITGTPTGGSFTLTVAGFTTAPIAYNALGSAVQSALQALVSVGTGGATVTGSAGGPYTVTFAGPLAGQPLANLTATASFTGGTTPGITIAKATPGVLGYQSVGLVTEDGVARDVKESSKEVTAFGISVPVRKIVTSSEVTFKLTFLETNKWTAAIYNRLALGSIAPTAGAFSVVEGTFRSQRYAAAFDVVDGTNHIRMFAPNVEVTDRDTLNVKNGEPIDYGLSLTAYPDSNGNALTTFYSVTGLI